MDDLFNYLRQMNATSTRHTPHTHQASWVQAAEPAGFPRQVDVDEVKAYALFKQCQPDSLGVGA
jgi:hypothetical protein